MGGEFILSGMVGGILLLHGVASRVEGGCFRVVIWLGGWGCIEDSVGDYQGRYQRAKYWKIKNDTQDGLCRPLKHELTQRHKTSRKVQRNFQCPSSKQKH